MRHETVLDRKTLILLKEYCHLSFLKNFSLSGGTALALRLGHRRSYDLDLFSPISFTVFELEKELESYYGADFFKRGQLSNALFSTIKDIKSDFIFDYGKPTNPFENSNGIRIYSIEENIAMKLMAITGRGRKRDFFDLYFILKKYSFPQIIDFFTKKHNEERLIMLYKSFTYFEDAESDNDPELLHKKISWNKVKEELLKRVKEIKF